MWIDQDTNSCVSDMAEVNQMLKACRLHRPKICRIGLQDPKIRAEKLMAPNRKGGGEHGPYKVSHVRSGTIRAAFG